MTTPHQFSVTITDEHMDMYGHMNNAAYLKVYESARWNMITPRGFSAPEILERQQGPVVLEVNVRFMREIKKGEVITITTRTENYVGKIGKIKQQMLKEDGTLASEAVFTFGFLDMVARKLILPPPEWLVAIGAPKETA